MAQQACTTFVDRVTEPDLKSRYKESGS